MTKDEMEDHARAYAHYLEAAQAAMHGNEYILAIKNALAATAHADGMMRYHEKYNGTEFETIESIELIFRAAPTVFDLECLDGVETILGQHRRIIKNVTVDFADALKSTRRKTREAYRWWTILDQSSHLAEDSLPAMLGGDGAEQMVERWVQCGLARRDEGKDGRQYITLNGRLREQSLAKCPACRTVSSAAKILFLETAECPKCHAKVDFVILGGLPVS
jgi:hypothetical protein